MAKSRNRKCKSNTQKGVRTTLEDVCDALGVSTATVSRALNDKPGVSEALRKKVLAAVKEMNYIPRAAARDLSRADTDTVGVVFQDLTSGWLLSVFRGIMSYASGHRYHVITSLSTSEEDAFDLPRRMLAEGRIAGLLWMDLRADREMVAAIKAQGVPFVLLQREMKDLDVDTVAIERIHGAYEVMQYLLELGIERPMLITGAETDEDSQKKLRGVEMALAEKGKTVPPERRQVGHHVGIHAVHAFERYLEEGHPMPDGIFAFNDDMAIAILNWLRAHGYRVPEDVVLAGFDGIRETEYLGLTTFETPMHEMGILAAKTLVERITSSGGAEEPRHILLQGNLRVRSTTRRQ